jgi:hypothetical protein
VTSFQPHSTSSDNHYHIPSDVGLHEELRQNSRTITISRFFRDLTDSVSQRGKCDYQDRHSILQSTRLGALIRTFSLARQHVRRTIYTSIRRCSEREPKAFFSGPKAFSKGPQVQYHVPDGATIRIKIRVTGLSIPLKEDLYPYLRAREDSTEGTVRI